MPDPVALVVDDEPLIRIDTADMISDAGYHVIEARSAAEALEVLQAHMSLKLLVTDIHMPGSMDGLALARHVGEHWPHIHIVVASGAVTPKAGELPEGAHFLGKPMDQAMVMEALTKLQSDADRNE